MSTKKILWDVSFSALTVSSQHNFEQVAGGAGYHLCLYRSLFYNTAFPASNPQEFYPYGIISPLTIYITWPALAPMQEVVCHQASKGGSHFDVLNWGLCSVMGLQLTFAFLLTATMIFFKWWASTNCFFSPTLHWKVKVFSTFLFENKVYFPDLLIS